MKNILLTTGLLIALLSATTGIASASGEPVGNFTIYPSYEHEGNTSWIILRAAQGSLLRDYITLENLTSSPQTITLTAAEAEATQNAYLINDSADPKTFSGWIKFEKTEHTLKPFEKRQIPFEVSIPKEATLTEHSGAILASQSNRDTNNLNIVTRIGVRTYINVVPKGAPPADTGFKMAAANTLFETNSTVGKIFFILSSLALTGAVFYTAGGYMNKRKHAKN